VTIARRFRPLGCALSSAKEAAVKSNCVRNLSVLACVLLTVLAAAAAPVPKPTPRQIAQWIEQLGDNRFTVRENASKKLWEAGAAAEAALEKALKSEDSEVVRRARDILDKFRWGIYPDTPADIVALIRTYQSAEGNTRVETIQKLLESGPAGLQAVLKIAQAEKDPNQRKIMGDLISSKLPASFPQVLENRNYERYEALLELGHEGGFIDHRQYTAYWLLRGKLDERIAHFESLLKTTPKAKRNIAILVYLNRAKGDMPAARRAAEQAGHEDLLEAILYEMADWKALAARKTVGGATNTIEKLAFRTAFTRLAGESEESSNALTEMRREVVKSPERDNSRFELAKTLLLNDRPTEGIEALAKIPERQTVLFEILAARLQFPEALALVNQPRPANDRQTKELDILKGRTLYLLGEKDNAQATFARLAEKIKEGVDPFWVASLLETEYRLGLKDQAFEHCGKLLDSTPLGQPAAQLPSICLNKVFPSQGEVAEILWDLLRARFKEERATVVLRRMRDILEGKAEARELRAWIEKTSQSLTKSTNAVTEAPGAEARKQRALAEAAAAAGMDDLASSILEKAGTSDALIRLGDLRAAKKQWAKAAERYRQAWRLTVPANDGSPAAKSSSPLSLFLAGDALVKAGQEAEGKRLMEESHWVLLGDAAGRFAFLRALAQRGFTEAVRRETDLLLRVSEPGSQNSGAALRLLAQAALARKDYLAGADRIEQSMLRCLHSYTSFVLGSLYVTIPSNVHQLRAQGLLAAGDFERAKRHIELALAGAPGNVELPITLVPVLERGGHKKEAAALFERCLGAYTKVCQDYPRCAWAHNSAAWMSACCRRNLDDALKHSEEAVKLEPKNAGYLDTLAEVHFQRGDKDKAVALQKRVVELDPKRSYYRKQLRRLEAGDPSAERPPEDQD
jgi:tetratricopeptide (TPR) repeat protein